MKQVKQILNEALKDIQPDKGYEKEIFRRLNELIRKINQNQSGIRAILGGSGAKGTWLRTFDADIFALFDYGKYNGKSDRLSDILEKILKRKFKNLIRIHGSRDYFQLRQGTFTFEIVPILKIRKASQAKNITDVSPLHSQWARKHRKLANDMKLTKQFCKAQRIYGAESYINGFSGYVCEILTAHYGSFMNLVKNAAKWQDRAVVDAAKYYKGKDVFREINTSKLVSPLIVIDPVQKDRNASAALSREKYDKLKHSCSEFLKSPSKRFFEEGDMGKSFLGSKSGSRSLFAAKAKPLAGKIDVVGGKLLKIYEFMRSELARHGFKLIKSGWEWDRKNDALFYLLLEKKPLPKNVEIAGPPLDMKEHVANFKKAHKNNYPKSGKIFALVPRKFTRPEDLIRALMRDKSVRERSKSMSFRML
ncbi:nucleotidyltransferase domain-containing protein [Candidatus Woesearchaeota archaeon]|nr:nucleotidyltransferase domain-containing protein [Candidatus Woesearchaeota archaeon]